MEMAEQETLFYDSQIWCDTRKILSKLRSEDVLIDLTIKVDRESFNCHKCIIEHHIPYFREEIKKNAKECSNLMEIELNCDIKPSIFKIILDYVYVGSLPIDATNLTQLSDAAKFLQISELSQACSEFPKKSEGDPTLKTVIEQRHFTSNFSVMPFIKCTYMKCELYIDKVALNAEYGQTGDPVLAVRDNSERFVAAFNGSIMYIVGGGKKQAPVTSIWRFDTKEREWTPNILKLPSPRWGTSGCFYNGKIYVIGGASQEQLSNAIEEYDIKHNAWKCLAPMNYTKVYASVVGVNNCIWSFGGIVNKQTSDKVECYDIENDKCTLHLSMPFKRSEMAITVMHGNVIVAGGKNEFFQRCKSVYKFNPKTGIWTEMASMQVNRTNFSIHPFYNCIVAIGGDENQYINEIWNPRTNAWSKIYIKAPWHRGHSSNSSF